MLGEIGNSHTYVGGGDDGETGPTPSHAGLLGVDLALDAASGRYRFATIYPGDNTRDDYRSPLAQPGLEVKPATTCWPSTARELRAPTDPDSLLQLPTPTPPSTLTVADTPSGAPRHVVGQAGRARSCRCARAAWIAHNRARGRQAVRRQDRLRLHVATWSSSACSSSCASSTRSSDKQALIMDDRWNGGGFIAPIALERLRRVLVALGTNREGGVTTEPQQI